MPPHTTKKEFEMTTAPGFIEGLWDGLKAEALTLEAAAIDRLKALETAAVADIKDVFTLGAPLAVKAIEAEAVKIATGQEKFGSAVASVTQQLEVELGPVAIQDVQALIQLAFRGLPFLLKLL
jgi:hypothetical protein